MNEIVVLSGKGGTGKTSLSASFAVLEGDGLVVADCDVDAADMHLLLEPDRAEAADFHGGMLAVIDPDLCNGCGRCATACRFEAVVPAHGRFAVDPLDCEGCGYCAHVCPTGAVVEVRRRSGRWFRSSIRTGTQMVHAELDIGAENSGKLVAKVKEEARRTATGRGLDLVLVDGSPGVGCPVVSSLSGASLAVLVTEPTVSALHDLERVHRLVRSFDVPAVCILNKADLHEGQRRRLLTFLADNAVDLLAEIPYDRRFTEAAAVGRSVVETGADLHSLVADCWSAMKSRLGGSGVPDRRTA